jgi:MraZ protein
MLFRGGKLRNLDSKGRLMLPQEILDTLASRSSDGKMMMTAFIDKCVAVYPMQDWNVLEEELTGLNEFDLKVRWVRRTMIGRAVEMQTDAQGRIRIPKELMDYAGIKDDVMVMGQGRRFELWQPERMETETISPDLDDLAKIVGEGRTLSL